MVPKTLPSLTYTDRVEIFIFILEIWSHQKANTFFQFII